MLVDVDVHSAWGLSAHFYSINMQADGAFHILVLVLICHHICAIFMEEMLRTLGEVYHIHFEGAL